MKTNIKLWYFASSSLSSAIIHQEVRPEFKDGWTCITSGYPDQETLIKEHCIQPDPCSVCGKIYSASFVPGVRKVMLSEKICHTCYHWWSLAQRQTSHSLRIAGHHYQVEPDIYNPSQAYHCAGFGGREIWYSKDGGPPQRTRNLWHQGDISPHWRSLLPDNAVFCEKPLAESAGGGNV